ncbi:NUDIX hydrolase N-terminal domain-containing protein [Culicoidibacter larvae]|uniref:NUDIX domain-containing protein n=1 Tax=Culicoidibacter larvae TaxID=2579976 RepID=A0A5R8QBE8_9FIRM|nr:NUDIX hydrolase N-terminal domain-containing protein [Culicoidibacter larvae]TLG73901.1 NUDIX domain-containing protein [Culicoidibacter larvae]
MTDKYFEFIKKVQAIAQIGQSFTTDEYARENYEELEKLSHEILEAYTGVEQVRPNIYADYKYPTAQTSVRTLVINDTNQLLLVQEKDSGLWSPPGGWCDVDTTPRQAAVKEVFEESGYAVEIKQFLAVFDHRLYLDRPSFFSTHQYVFAARVIGGEPVPNHETLAVEWFDLDKLPQLSRKMTLEEITIALGVLVNERDTYID